MDKITHKRGAKKGEDRGKTKRDKKLAERKVYLQNVLASISPKISYPDFNAFKRDVAKRSGWNRTTFKYPEWFRMLSDKYQMLSGSLQQVNAYTANPDTIEKAVELRDLKIQELSREAMRLKKIFQKEKFNPNMPLINKKIDSNCVNSNESMSKSNCAYVFSILLEYLDSEGLGLAYNEEGDLIDDINNKVIIPANKLDFMLKNMAKHD